MKTRHTTAALGAAVLALALVGCTDTAGDSGDSGGPGGMYGSGDDTAEKQTTGMMSLGTADTDLGEIVVDDEGMTVYMFDSDTQGAGESTCSGQCLDNWPPVTTEGSDVAVDGVTGDVSTIDGPEGATQVTLDGWPLYYFAGDSAPGDVTGQAVSDVWWVLAPDGQIIRE